MRRKHTRTHTLYACKQKEAEKRKKIMQPENGGEMEIENEAASR